MLFCDLAETKKLLDIRPKNTKEDVKLAFLIEMASAWITELIGNRPMEFKSRTEYYAGTGSQQLLLNARPVYSSPTIAVNVDEGGWYGSVTDSFSAATTKLTYGTDFALDLDRGAMEDAIASKSGILVRIDAHWPKPRVRQQGYLSPFLDRAYGNVKVVYTAGYTQDTLPAQLRLGAAMLVSRLRSVLPLGFELGSESYEDRSHSIVTSEKSKLLALIWPFVFPFRNFRW